MNDETPELDVGETLARIFAVIEGRKTADPEQSYVARLMNRGPKKIAQKVGEEAVEVAIAAVSETREAVVSESADLLFHMMVLWSRLDLSPADVVAELAAREGVSGIVEKKSRKW